MTGSAKLVMDTNVLRDEEFVSWARRHYYGPLATSIISYIEYKRQLIAKNKDYDLRKKLRDMKVEILPLSVEVANIAAFDMAMRKDPRCEKCGNIDWADMIIYASLEKSSYLLVTKNKKDFPECRVVTPEELLIINSRR